MDIVDRRERMFNECKFECWIKKEGRKKAVLDEALYNRTSTYVTEPDGVDTATSEYTWIQVLDFWAAHCLPSNPLTP